MAHIQLIIKVEMYPVFDVFFLSVDSCVTVCAPHVCAGITVQRQDNYYSESLQGL